MANWDDIPIDVAQLIAEHLEFYEDREHFGQVCKQWRLGLKRSNYRPSKSQTPLLLLTDPPDNSYRRYYSLINRMHRKVDLPPSILHNKDDQNLRYLSSRGWLISVSQKNLSMNLFNPFSGRVIRLPSVPKSQLDIHYQGLDENRYIVCFKKFILSADPSNTSDYRIAMIFAANEQLAFWRPGEEGWTKPALDVRICFDVCFFRGEFYSIDEDGKVIAHGGMKDRLPRVVAVVKYNVSTNFAYIVESESERAVLVIHRDVDIGEEKYGTKSFCVWEVNVENGETKLVESLGNRALFVGLNSTFCVEASERGCSANCIYFTDEYIDLHLIPKYSPNGGGLDMGVYCLTQRKMIDQTYEGPSRFDVVTPPIWLQLTSHAC